MAGVGLPRTYHLVAMSLSKTFASFSMRGKGPLIGLVERTVPPWARFTGSVPEHTLSVPDPPHTDPTPRHVPQASALCDAPQLSTPRKLPQFLRARAQNSLSLSGAHAGSAITSSGPTTSGGPASDGVVSAPLSTAASLAPPSPLDPAFPALPSARPPAPALAPPAPAVPPIDPALPP